MLSHLQVLDRLPPRQRNGSRGLMRSPLPAAIPAIPATSRIRCQVTLMVKSVRVWRQYSPSSPSLISVHQRLNRPRKRAVCGMAARSASTHPPRTTTHKRRLLRARGIHPHEMALFPPSALALRPREEVPILRIASVARDRRILQLCQTPQAEPWTEIHCRPVRMQLKPDPLCVATKGTSHRLEARENEAAEWIDCWRNQPIVVGCATVASVGMRTLRPSCHWSLISTSSHKGFRGWRSALLQRRECWTRLAAPLPRTLRH
mmetsp:Transcript_39176/g.104014  ORF Transcript_39176/g.104014 Transcript_39176/m.104014 type:complete len:261 (-) Transcript_39176:1690-2472(-)